MPESRFRRDQETLTSTGPGACAGGRTFQEPSGFLTGTIIDGFPSKVTEDTVKGHGNHTLAGLGLAAAAPLLVLTLLMPSCPQSLRPKL